MSWRIVVVSSNAKVDFKMDYLVIRSIDSTQRIRKMEFAFVRIINEGKNTRRRELSID